MTTQATLGEANACEAALYMVLELSDRSWKVLFQAPSGRRRERTVAARDVGQLLAEMAPSAQSRTRQRSLFAVPTYS